MMSETLLWIAVAVLYLFAAWALFLLWRMKRVTLRDGETFTDHDRRLELRYPPWWEVLREGDAYHFMSHEKDGVLRLSFIERGAIAGDVRELLDRYAIEKEIKWDDDSVEELCVNGLKGGHIESRATIGPGTRRYLQLWIFLGEQWIALFEYTSSVMFGMVDAFYIRQMMRTVRMPPQEAT